MELSTQRQPHRLDSVQGLDEFVITPAPNSYIVGVRLSAEHAAAVGHERIAIFLDVINDGTAIGISKVHQIQDDNSAGDQIEPESAANGHFSPILEAVLASEEIGDHCNFLVRQFLEDVGGFDAINASGIYKQTMDVQGLHGLLKEIFGE